MCFQVEVMCIYVSCMYMHMYRMRTLSQAGSIFWSSGCVICTQLSIQLNSISGSWQAIWGMFPGFGLQTNHHIPLCKLNMKPRSQNDFPARIFLPSLNSRGRLQRGLEKWKTTWLQTGERMGRYLVIYWHFRHFSRARWENKAHFLKHK